MTTMLFSACDCLPVDPQPQNNEDVAWFRALSAQLKSRDLLLSLNDGKDDNEPVIYCDSNADWRVGRFIGTVCFQGRTIQIKPRFGEDVLLKWISEITSDVSSAIRTDSVGRFMDDNSFILFLIFVYWRGLFLKAARHGLPFIKQQVLNTGTTIKGRLDIKASIRRLASDKVLTSRRTERSLDHAASKIIVAAYFILKRHLPVDSLIPFRLKELIIQLISCTGNRPEIPSKKDFDHIRYSPITSGFAKVAQLSYRIVKSQGALFDIHQPEACQGILLDVAELWELYVASILKKAATPLSVRTGVSNKALLYSPTTDKSMGTLIPDALLFKDGHCCAIADAKYKSLHSTIYHVAPQREDLYQMAAYFSRFATSSVDKFWGLLVYPFDNQRPELPVAEQGNPWTFGDGNNIFFIRLAHDPREAVEQLRALLLHHHYLV